MIIRKAIKRMSKMNERAWYIWEKSAQLAMMMLCCGLLLTLSADVHVRHLADTCYEVSEACFLIGILSSVIAEDQQSRR